VVSKRDAKLIISGNRVGPHLARTIPDIRPVPVVKHIKVAGSAFAPLLLFSQASIMILVMILTKSSTVRCDAELDMGMHGLNLTNPEESEARDHSKDIIPL
jgi:hypothetical protein